MADLQRDDVRLYFELHGPPALDGQPPPLVLLAGLASDCQSWAPVLPRLTADRQVPVYDRPSALIYKQAHSLPVEAPREFCRPLLDFLDRSA